MAVNTFSVFTLFRKEIRSGFHVGRIYPEEEEQYWWGERDQLTFCKLEAFDGYENVLMAVGLGGLDLGSAEYHSVNLGRDSKGTLVLRPSEKEPHPDRILVLVHEESPGVGRKRWPGFHID